MADKKNIWVLVEYHGSNPTEASLELLSKGRILAENLGCEVWVLAPEANADMIKTIAADKIWHSQNKQELLGVDMGKNISILMAKAKPALVLCTMSPQSVEAAAFVSAKCQTIYLPNVSGINVKNNKLHIQKLIYEGMAQAVTEAELDDTLILGCIHGVWGIKSKEMLPETKLISETVLDERSQIVNSYVADWQEIEVNEADVVVAGGNGMYDHEGFRKLLPIAAQLAAPVGGSRVAEDKGWIDHKAMIGATGQTIAPELYIACGISGAIQHTIGIQDSKRIIAINTDSMAAIMANADLRVVGDAGKILDELSLLLKDYAPVKEA
jgi:electron transfer flavoprotein alpha subunit